jgi:hypothetical protein
MYNMVCMNEGVLASRSKSDPKKSFNTLLTQPHYATKRYKLQKR